MPTFRPEVLQCTVVEAFKACGVPDEEAQIVASHLIEAELCGVRSHGLIRVPQYIQAVREGRIVPGAELTVVAERDSTAALDGHHGFGMVCVHRAMEIAMNKARPTGAAAVTLANCGHTGRLGSYTAYAARQGFVSIMMVNAGGCGQWMAPLGGTAGRLATNPISFAVPTGSGDPLVLDMATSNVPEGKIRSMLAAKHSIPEGWATDHQGRATTNPADLYGPPRGALLPFGGHKGFGLALVIDALAGGLSGAGCCTGIDAPMEGRTDGVFLMAIDVEAFAPRKVFETLIQELIGHVKSSPPASGFDEVLVPGEPEAREHRRQEKDGLFIDDATWRMVRATLDQLDVKIDD